jgi:hypothetical protein
LGSEDFVDEVKERLGERGVSESGGVFWRRIVGYLGHTLKSAAGQFGRDPVAISQGVGKLESRLREDENLRDRINDLTENLAKGRKRILI